MADLHRAPTGQGGSELTTMLTSRAHRPPHRLRPRPRPRARRIRHPAGAGGGDPAALRRANPPGAGARADVARPARWGLFFENRRGSRRAAFRDAPGSGPIVAVVGERLNSTQTRRRAMPTRWPRGSSPEAPRGRLGSTVLTGHGWRKSESLVRRGEVIE
jgi:hypothetical protein